MHSDSYGGVYTTLAAASCSTQMAAVTVLNIIFSVSEKELLVPMCFERRVFIVDLHCVCVWEFHFADAKIEKEADVLARAMSANVIVTTF